MDQQEMMELMMNRGKAQLKPHSFEKIAANCAMLKHPQGEVNDGVTVSMMAPLGNQFQMGGDWKFSNRDGASFELTSSINNSTGNPNQQPDEVQSGVFRLASDNTGMAMGNFNLPWGLTLSTQTMFQDPQVKDIMNVFSLSKDWRDCSLVARTQLMSQGGQSQCVYMGNFMQSLNKQIQAGISFNYIPQMGDMQFGYCGYYRFGGPQNLEHQISAAY